MDIFGIGPLEILFILVIALIVMGPRDMAKAGRTIGRILRRIVTSSTWTTIQDASREIRYLPNKLMREAGLEELKNQLPSAQSIGNSLGYAEAHKEAQKITRKLSAWTTPPSQEPETNATASEEEPVASPPPESEADDQSVDRPESLSEQS